ncbi:winged helix-turn-helix domain-containing protein [Saccharopolyspora sp. NPDC000995]
MRGADRLRADAGVVWTRKAVAELIRVRHGVVLSLRTVGNYRLSWGLSPQKPIRRAYEQDPEAVRRWPEEDYPAIAARTRREGAVILWLDETGIRGLLRRWSWSIRLPCGRSRARRGARGRPRRPAVKSQRLFQQPSGAGPAPLRAVFLYHDAQPVRGEDQERVAGNVRDVVAE